MTKRKLFSLAACILIFIAGWNVYDAFFRSYGTETFDDAFLAEFDAARIVDSIDRLRDTGLFSYQVSDTMEYPQIVATWPADSMLMQSPVCISVQKTPLAIRMSIRDTASAGRPWMTMPSLQRSPKN